MCIVSDAIAFFKNSWKVQYPWSDCALRRPPLHAAEILDYSRFIRMFYRLLCLLFTFALHLYTLFLGSLCQAAKKS